MTNLRKEADAVCKFRGHKMINWGFTLSPGGQRVQGGAICKYCGMDVSYDTKPPANGIDISGEAVALYCPKRGLT